MREKKYNTQKNVLLINFLFSTAFIAVSDIFILNRCQIEFSKLYLIHLPFVY